MRSRETPRFSTRGRLGTPRRLELDLGEVADESLADLLREARERKGVDLFRAERDTKIRARYLAALEGGDYRDLPGVVYTKGFLRNYALYLGLDPEDVLERFHVERGEGQAPAPAIAVPRPIAAPRQPLTITPGVIAGALMLLGVIAFAAYLGLQLFRFAKPPTVAITEPAIAVIEVEETTTSYVVRGEASPGASITIVTPGRDPIRGNADVDGTWAIEVELRRGRNQFSVTATDPETGKQTEAASAIFITVPFSQVQAPTIAVDQPVDGAEFKNGAIPIEGAVTNAISVTVAASLLEGTLPPAATTGDASGGSTTGTESVTVTPADDGRFSAPLELTAGRWAITVTANGAASKSASLTREVVVRYSGVAVVVTITGGRAWVKAWVDGQVDATLGSAGKVIGNGEALTLAGEESVEVRTGNSAVTYFSLNGVDLGRLDTSGSPSTWLFAPPNEPVRTERR